MTFEYTPEIVAELTQRYNAAKAEGYPATVAFVEEFSDEMGLKPAQVRAKLVSLDEVEYMAKPKVRKTVATKDKLVAAIAKQIEVDEEVLDSMSKATKNALVLVFGKVNALRKEAGRDTVTVK